MMTHQGVCLVSSFGELVFLDEPFFFLQVCVYCLPNDQRQDLKRSTNIHFSVNVWILWLILLFCVA
jgi:hypothetical protein